MENEQKKLVLLSEYVSISEEAKLNPTFLTIDVKLCDSSINLNREGVTAEFIESFVATAGDHVCLPFYADVKNLLAKNYQALGHRYDKMTRTFGTQIVGSFYEFHTETDDNGVVSLYGKIRVPKRDREIIYRLVDLYEMGRFAVSTEVSYDPRECEITADGKYIVASENSSLNGLCLVWTPACADAYAMDMVAEAAENSEEIVTEGDELTAERGETKPMEKENITAEVTEERKTEAVAETEDKDTAIAEGEGASESGEGASESGEGGEGASESGEGASESGEGASEPGGEGASEGGGESASEGGGSGASEGGDEGGGGGSGDTTPADAVIDPSEEQKKEAVAETNEANAEVLEHSFDTHESVEQCPYSGETVHVIEYHERILETLEDAGNLIAELDRQIAELNEIKTKYDAIMAEEQKKALAEKQAKARAFAEKQGLNTEDVAVAEAIANIDYGTLAELSMAEEQEEAKEPVKQTITLASFVEMEVSEDKYGGLLSRRNK